jgi:hypothetical protein
VDCQHDVSPLAKAATGAQNIPQLQAKTSVRRIRRGDAVRPHVFFLRRTNVPSRLNRCSVSIQKVGAADVYLRTGT